MVGEVCSIGRGWGHGWGDSREGGGERSWWWWWWRLRRCPGCRHVWPPRRRRHSFFIEGGRAWAHIRRCVRKRARHRAWVCSGSGWWGCVAWCGDAVCRQTATSVASPLARTGVFLVYSIWLPARAKQIVALRFSFFFFSRSRLPSVMTPLPPRPHAQGALYSPSRYHRSPSTVSAGGSFSLDSPSPNPLSRIGCTLSGTA